MITAVAVEPVERAAHLGVLEELFTGCQGGNGGVAIVRGPVACGKTWLIDCFAGRMRDRAATVLTATIPTEGGHPLAVVPELFADLVHTPAGEQAARLVQPVGDGGEPMTSATMSALRRTLFELATPERPLVVCVDDVDHADRLSLQWLVNVARHVRSHPVLLVVSESALADPPRSGGEIDLLRRHEHHVLTVGPLTVAGVVTLLRQTARSADAERLAPLVTELTGGNPLLVGGLLEEGIATRTGKPVPGTVYRRAVLACLERSDVATRRVGEALAMLGGAASDARVGRLLGMYVGSVVQSRRSLAAAGLIDDLGRWHPQARVAILDAMPDQARAELHGRTAELLYRDGAPLNEVVRHLAFSDSLDAPWSMEVFASAVDEGGTREEILCLLDSLQLALDLCSDERQRAEIISFLARTEWQIDPEMAYRRIPDLGAAVALGHLRGACAAQVVLHLLWCGRLEQAVAALDRLLDDAEQEPGGADPAVLTAWQWMSIVHPTGVARRTPPTSPSGVATHPHILLVTALAGWIAGSAEEDAAVALAQQVLHTAHPRHTALGSMIAALSILISADRLDEAGPLCDALFEESELVHSPFRDAMLNATRGAIHLRSGELAEAERCAADGLELVSPAGWGIAVGAPLSVLVLAATGRGRLDVALEHLSIPVPDSMFQTVLGLPYLYARGRFHLATGGYPSALADFRSGADLMDRWGFDRPTILPWRTMLAEAYLGLGEPERARALVDEQLARLDSRHERALSRTLRLREAVGGSLPAGRRAAPPQLGEMAVDRPVDDVGVVLSPAEQRVVELAVRGYINREIAAKLYVTASTVEQHLTRVYRKLNINGRSDLLARLGPGTPDGPAGAA